MRGTHQITVRNNKLQIKLTVKRNITILQGQSATGKTTLIELIRDFDELGPDSGSQVSCDVPCKVVSGRNWHKDLSDIEDSIVFIDEDNAFIRSQEFASAAKSSSNYYVLVSRGPLAQLPYSVDEIYGLKNTGKATSKYPSYRRTYTSTYRIYADDLYDGARPDLVIVEDGNSGFEFFSALCKRNGIPRISAQSKSKIYDCALHADADSILVIADGAAFGSEIQLVLSLSDASRRSSSSSRSPSSGSSSTWASSTAPSSERFSTTPAPSSRAPSSSAGSASSRRSSSKGPRALISHTRSRRSAPPIFSRGSSRPSPRPSPTSEFSA